MLSQGEPRDATVNFDTYRILQRHHAFYLPQHRLYISNHSNAVITDSTLIFTAVTQSRKSRHMSKITVSHDDHEYVRDYLTALISVTIGLSVPAYVR